MKDLINNDGSHCLVEFYHLPGFSKDESATIVFRGEPSDCRTEFGHLDRANAACGSKAEYRYEIRPFELAGEVVKKTNEAKALALKIWRNKVFGEPITA